MKRNRILRNILLGILIFVVAVVLILQIGVTVRYWDFFSNAKMTFMIPGLLDNFVPQGFDYIEDSKTYLIAGYMSDDTASRVYVRDSQGNVRTTMLYDMEGKPYLQHAGGICHNGQYAYLPSDRGIDVFLLADILSGNEAKMIGSVETGHDMAYCTFYEGYLLAGNFYYAGHYETPDHHRLTTPAGDRNTGVMTVFRADESREFGIDPNAVAAFSTRERVQGMCFTSDSEMVLSTSWGLNDSALYVYQVDTNRVGTMQTATGEVPLYYLDSENLVKTVVTPPMAEELVFLEGRIWIMCESACNKYLFGRLIRGDWVYALKLG